MAEVWTDSPTDGLNGQENPSVMVDENGFVGYVPSTTNPGSLLITITLAFAAFSIIILPCLVIVGKRLDKLLASFTKSHGKDDPTTSGNVNETACTLEDIPEEDCEAKGPPVQMTRIIGHTTTTGGAVHRVGNSGRRRAAAEQLVQTVSKKSVEGSVVDGSEGIPATNSVANMSQDDETSPSTLITVGTSKDVDSASEKAYSHSPVIAPPVRRSRKAMSEPTSDYCPPSSNGERSNRSQQSNLSMYSNASSFMEAMMARKPRRIVRGKNKKNVGTAVKGIAKELFKETEKSRMNRRASAKAAEILAGVSDLVVNGEMSEKHQMGRRASAKAAGVIERSASFATSGDKSDLESSCSIPIASPDASSTHSNVGSETADSEAPRPKPERKLSRIRSGYVEEFSHPVDSEGGPRTQTAMSTGDISDVEKVNVDKTEDLQVDYTMCFGRKAIWRPSVIKEGFDTLVQLFEYDADFHRLVKLAVPFTSYAVVLEILDCVHIAVISAYLGVSVTSAVVVVDVLVGFTAALAKGVPYGQASLTRRAMIASNSNLVGEYFQMSVVLYTLLTVPFAALWWFSVTPVMLWFGFSQSVALIGQSYARVAVIREFLEGLSECVGAINQINGHDFFSAMVGLFEAGTVVVVAIVYLVVFDGSDIVDLTWLQIGTGLGYLIFVVIVSLLKGWLRPYVGGMCCVFAISNVNAVWNLMKAILPLSLGEALAYAERQILTIFCVHLGPAEVVAWLLLQYTWEVFEASTQAFGDAGEIRIGYYLARGLPSRAKKTSYQCLLISSVFALISTSVFFLIGDDLPRLFTSDPTLQHLMQEALPLMGIGNLTMTFGLTCWSLIGAQGRYLLATKVSTFSSWVVTTPLAAYAVYGLNLSIEALVAAISIGHSFCGLVDAYILLRTDWGTVAKSVQQYHAFTGAVLDKESEVGFACNTSGKNVPASSISGPDSNCDVNWDAYRRQLSFCDGGNF